MCVLCLCVFLDGSSQGLPGLPGAEGAEGKPGTQVPILYHISILSPLMLIVCVCLCHTLHQCLLSKELIPTNKCKPIPQSLCVGLVPSFAE